MNALKVFIPSKNRAESLLTHRWLEGKADYYVVVHDDAQKGLYVRRGDLPAERVIVSGVPGDEGGKSRQQEWIMRHLVGPDEWFVFADDNIEEITVVDPAYYDYEVMETRLRLGAQGRAVYHTPCSIERFWSICAETRQLAELSRTVICGFAMTENPMLRGRKWRFVGLVRGKLMLWQNHDLPFDHSCVPEDAYMTAVHLLRRGGVVINQWLYPRAKRFQPGGQGTRAERYPFYQRDNLRLMAAFPGLFQIKNRPGQPLNVELQVRLHSLRQLAQWRAEMLQKES